MKEFEKWFRKNRPYEIYSCIDMAEKAWQAALEWILSCDTGPEADELIKEELEY